MPALKITPKLLPEDARANLPEAVGADRCPAHLLPLDGPFAHDLVDGGYEFLRQSAETGAGPL